MCQDCLRLYFDLQGTLHISDKHYNCFALEFRSTNIERLGYLKVLLDKYGIGYSFSAVNHPYPIRLTPHGKRFILSVSRKGMRKFFDLIGWKSSLCRKQVRVNRFKKFLEEKERRGDRCSYL